MITLLAALLALSIGFVLGYRTRPQQRPMWACARCDDEALLASERARFDALIADLGIPDDPDTCTRKDQTT